MLDEEKVIDVGSSKFRNIVGENFSKVRIVMGEVYVFLEFRKDNKKYRTRNPVNAENAQRAWRSVFTGSSIPSEVIITSSEEVRMDILIERGVHDPLNESTNFIGARC